MKNEIVIGAIAVAAALVGYLYWQSTQNAPATATQQTSAGQNVGTATPPNAQNTKAATSETTQAAPQNAETTQAATPPADAAKQQ